MNTPATRPFAALATVTLLALAGNAAAQSDPDVETLEREIAELEDRLDALRERLDDVAPMDDSPKTFGFGDGLAGAEDGRKVHRIVEDPEALREAARGIEDALEDADIFESLAELLIRVSEDLVVVEDADSLSFTFKGREVASVEADSEDRMTIRAMGRKLTVEAD